jgi:poly(A) polymerase
MNNHPLHLLPGSFQLICRLSRGQQNVYLVGGAVRDLLAGRRTHDLDFAVSGDVRPLARQAADLLNGAFYMLDEERNTARVIFQEDDQRSRMDFAALRSNDLHSDLEGRDFTINAMALDLANPETLLDPLHGAQDLLHKILRICNPHSIEDDPVRILRAVRLSLDFGLRITPETLSAIRAGMPLLEKISAERQRDELFRMLDGGQVASAVRLLDSIGALPMLLPELAELKNLEQPAPHVHDGWEHTLAVVNKLSLLFDVLVSGKRENTADNLPMGSAALSLGRFRANLAQHYAARLNPDRSLRSLLFLAALYHDIGKPQAKNQNDVGKIIFHDHENVGAVEMARRARALVLSQVEIDRLKHMIAGHMRIHNLVNSSSPPSSRAIYRYFRALGDAGVDICLLSLADTLATASFDEIQERYLKELETCQIMLESWWEKAESRVNPPRLLSGLELIQHFKLEGGPLIGKLLENIREAQACGEVSTRAEALEFAQKWLEKAL